MSVIDWFGLIAPFVVYLIMLVVYFVWEGRREDRLHEKYSQESEGVTDG